MGVWVQVPSSTPGRMTLTRAPALVNGFFGSGPVRVETLRSPVCPRQSARRISESRVGLPSQTWTRRRPIVTSWLPTGASVQRFVNRCRVLQAHGAGIQTPTSKNPPSTMERPCLRLRRPVKAQSASPWLLQNASYWWTRLSGFALPLRRCQSRSIRSVARSDWRTHS
jgi:hypothetical protein